MVAGHRALTLVEVLVSVAIVALLATLTLGVTAHAKKEGYRAKATSDGRQIYLAMSLYAEDAGRWHFGPTDDFVDSGHLREAAILVAPTDGFQHGYGGEILDKASTFRYRVRHPVSWEGHFRGRREDNQLYFEKVARFDDNPGILALRVLGDRNPDGGASGVPLLLLYSGPMIRIRIDGSVQRARFPIFDRAGGGDIGRRIMCPAYLFTDARDPLLCKF